jgi:hypothetical protein
MSNMRKLLALTHHLTTLAPSITNSLNHGSTVYSQLEAEEIRLTTLLPGVGEAPIYCQLVHTVPRRDSCTYEALSYMWGPHEPAQPIPVDRNLVYIRQNMWAALKLLRDERSPRAL